MTLNITKKQIEELSYITDAMVIRFNNYYAVNATKEDIAELVLRNIVSCYTTQCYGCSREIKEYFDKKNSSKQI